MVFLLLISRNFVVSVRRSFLFLWVPSLNGLGKRLLILTIKYSYLENSFCTFSFYESNKTFSRICDLKFMHATVIE